MAWTQKIPNKSYESLTKLLKQFFLEENQYLVEKIFIWEFSRFKIQYIQAQKVEKNKTDVKGRHHNCTKCLNQPWPGTITSKYTFTNFNQISQNKSQTEVVAGDR